MKISKHDSTIERQILTAMVVDSSSLGHITAKWRPGGLFRSRWANLIAGWCVKYHKRYNKAPGGSIMGMFNQWAEKAHDEDTIELVEKFLYNLSEEYSAEAEGINPEYIIDLAGTHFNAVLLEAMAEAIQTHIDHGDPEKAEALVAQWGRVEMGIGTGIDVLHDKEAIRDAFEANAEPLIKYSGALGKFFGSQLGRDEFIGITGATARGKTWWLLDIAWQGMRQGRRVAFFEVGDMSQNQIMKRFMCRAAEYPVKPPYEFDIPVNISKEKDETIAEIETNFKVYKGPLNWQTAWIACEKRLRRHKKSLLKLSVHPNSSINVEGIVGILDTWERNEWIPDVVVIDYADILAIPSGQRPGERDAINETWKQLRALSQSRHILVVTATQADAKSYDAKIVRRHNFSDDRRKNDHVTGMLGINATEEEQEMGICRLNWIKRREEAFIESHCVHVAGCLNIGRPHIVSTF